LTNAREALKELQQPLNDTAAAMLALQPGAAALGEATPDLRAAMRTAISPLNRLPGVDDNAVPAVDALTKTLRDAHDLAPLLRETVTRAQAPLAALMPYSSEIRLFFANFASAMADGDSAGHWLRINLPVGAQQITGVLPIQDPTVARDPYAPPGVALNEKTTGLFAGSQGGGR